MGHKRILTKVGVVAAALTAGVLAAPATPALAAGNGNCSYGLHEYSCSTGTVTPNGSRQIVISAITNLGGYTTCRAHDAVNGNQVGAVTAHTPMWRTSKTIGGLYGRYFLVCTGPYESKGGGTIAG